MKGTSSRKIVNTPKFPLDVYVRFADRADVTVFVDDVKGKTISWVKLQLRSRLDVADIDRRRLRLIQAGRIVSDTTQLLSLYPLRLDEDAETRKGKAADRDTPRLWFHCSIGGIDETDSQEQQPSTLPAPRGFDRLLEAGFSESDIAELRSQFHSTSDGNDENEQMRLLEERWIDDSANEIEAGSQAGYEEMLYGICLGFFLGLLSLWIIWEGSFGGWSITKRGKWTIVAGVGRDLLMCAN